MRKSLAAGALLAGAVLLSGCGGGAGGGPDVEGRTFTGTHAEGFTLEPNTELWVSFSGNQVSARAGCNTMFGAATWRGETLEVGDLAITEMGCPPDLHAQDDTVATLLTSGPAVTLEGHTLRIAGEGRAGRAIAVELHELLDAELQGTRWELTSLEHNEAVSSLPAGVAASLVIAGGRAEVDFGCNTGTGDVAVGEGTVEFSPLAVTDAACAGEARGVQEAMERVLQGPVIYSIDGRTMRLTSGAEGLHFRAAPE